MTAISNMFIALFCLITIVDGFHSALRIKSLKSHSVLYSTEANPLDIGDFDKNNVLFTKEESVSGNINKYRLAATIKPKDTNSYLADYKEEIKRRGVVFPGFRSGKLPPYVMPDVRRYIVCYGLEALLGQLCNLNSLEICDEKGGEVAFGEDSFYESIVADTPTGKKFADVRDSWRENTDFTFVANFYAKLIEETSEATPVVVEGEKEEVIGLPNNDAIDAEIVQT